MAVPGAPTISSVAVGSTTASVSFTPGSDGGSTITGYRYSTDDGTTWTTTSTTSPVAVIGLSDGATYTFELEATNVSGNGAPATTSFNTTAPPSAPVIGSIASGDEALTVSFAAPASGGSPITDYDWSTDGGTNWYSEDAAGTPCQDTSDTVTCAVDTLSTDGQTPLTNGVSYPIQVRGRQCGRHRAGVGLRARHSLHDAGGTDHHLGRRRHGGGEPVAHRHVHRADQ